MSNDENTPIAINRVRSETRQKGHSRNIPTQVTFIWSELKDYCAGRHSKQIQRRVIKRAYITHNATSVQEYHESTT